MMISTRVAGPMSTAARRAVLFLAILEAVFMILEMFFWDFVTAQLTEYNANVVSATRALGANMGLYNGFLAAGLAWSLRAPPDHDARLALFFVGCVLAAGVFGWTVNWKLLMFQALPAACVLVVLLNHSRSR